MIEGGWLVYATFAVYLVVVLVIGVVAWRRTGDLADYILGGRSLGRWVTALSTQASAMSGWLLLGLPGFAYLRGIDAIWMAAGLLIGTYLNWKLVARRLRDATAGLGDSLTLPVYLERRFEDGSGLLRYLSAAFILVFFTAYTASGLAAGGKLFEAVFGWPYLWATAGGTLVVIGYTFLGGFLAVSWTDAIQGALMWLALLAVAVTGVWLAGGPAGIADAMRTADPARLSPWQSPGGEAIGFIGLASLLGWGLGYFGQPHVMARFMAIRSPGDIPAALRIAMSWIVVAMLAAVVVGWAGFALVSPPLTGADSEKVFIMLTADLLPPAIAGICLAGILAAIMSTADSQLLVASSAFTEDLYARLGKAVPTQRRLVMVGRLAVAGIALVAFAFAMDPESRVLDLVAYAWAGLGATFGPAVLMSLYWRGMSRAGALAGILTGGLTVILWSRLDGGWFDLYELVPGFVFSMVGIVLGSRIFPPRSAA